MCWFPILRRVFSIVHLNLVLLCCLFVVRLGETHQVLLVFGFGFGFFLFLHLLQFIYGLQERLAPIFVEDVGIANEGAGVVPFVVPREHMKGEQF